MTERAVAVFPGVAFPQMLGVQFYALVLTNRRSLFVREGGDRLLVTNLLGDRAAGRVDTGRGEGANLEALAEEERNRSVEHDALRRIRLRRRTFRIDLRLDYRPEAGRAERLRVQILPPKAFVERHRGAAGRKGKAFEAYAAMIRDGYEEVLPSSTGVRRDWRV